MTVKNETKLVVCFPSYKVKCITIVKKLGATLLHIHKSKVKFNVNVYYVLYYIKFMCVHLKVGLKIGDVVG